MKAAKMKIFFLSRDFKPQDYPINERIIENLIQKPLSPFLVLRF